MKKNLILGCFVALGCIYASGTPVLAKEEKKSQKEHHVTAHKGKPKSDTVVATVRGEKILVKDLEKLKEVSKELKEVSLDTVIEGRKLGDLLRDEIVAKKLLEKEIEKAVKDDDKELKEEVKRCKEMAKTQIALKRKAEERVKESEIRTLYDQLIKHFKPEKVVTAKHILLPDEATAKKVAAELSAARGANFDQLVEKHSIDTVSKKSGGLLGTFSRKKAEKVAGPEFAEAIFILKPGSKSFTDPVKTSAGWHIIQVMDSKMSEAPSFEDASTQLRQLKMQEALMKYFDDLRKEADVKLFDLDGNPVKMDENIEAGMVETETGA